MNHEYFKYFIDLNTYIVKDIKIHFFLNFIDFFFCYTSIIDGLNNQMNNNNNKKYSIPNIFSDYLFKHVNQNIIIGFLFLIILINFIFFGFYNYIFKKKNITSTYINYNEIFHLRLFPIFYFSITSKFKGNISFYCIILMIIFIITSIYHFKYYHIDFFVPDFIQIPYDNFSSQFDLFYLIFKFFIPFSLINKDIEDFILFVSYSIIFLISGYVIYIFLFLHIFLILNKSLNIIKISLNFSICVIIIILLFYKKLSFFSLKFILIEINVFMFCILLSIILISFVAKPNLETNNEYRIYHFFCFYYNKNYINKLSFISAFNEHKLNCGKCILCNEISLDDNLDKDNEEIHMIPKTNNSIEIMNDNYSKKFTFFITLKLIMDTYIKNGYNSLIENKKLSIAILMTLNNLSTQKKNIHQYITLLSIYHKIINEKKNEIEDIKLFMNEIYIINDFIQIASQIIDFLIKLFSSTKNALNINILLELITFASKLDSKNFKNYLQSNKKFKNSIYQLTISTIIYEEIFNKPVHKSHFISIREHYQDLEETLNLFALNKQITFNLDILEEKMILLRSGQEFYELIGTNFFHLFPKGVYEYQKHLIKKIICFPEDSDNEIKTIQLIIKSHESNLYNIIKLNFKIFLQEDNIGIIIIDGIYSIYTNILISYTNNDIEYFFGSGVKLKNFPINKNKKIKFNDITLKEGIKFDYSFKSNDNIYKIYKLGEEKNENDDLQLYNGTELMENSKSFILANFQSGISSSSVASITSIKDKTKNIDKIRLKTINLAARRVNMKFFIYQKLIILFILLLFILSFIEFFQKKSRKLSLVENYNVYTKFRLVSRTFNYMVSSFRAITCLKLSNDSNCINYLEQFSNNFNKKYGTDFDIIYGLYISNEIKVRHESNYMSELWSIIYSNPDKSIRSFFIDTFIYKDISTIEKNGSLIISSTEINFMESFKATMNSFIILNSSEYKYIKEPFYIIDIKDTKLLNYYSQIRENWRVELYNIILNYENFCQHFDIIDTKYNNKLDKQLKLYFRETLIYIIINCIVELMEIFIIILILQTFENVMYKIFIYIKKRISYQNFNPTFIKKMEKLKELTFMYLSHPKNIIEALQEIYDKYKKQLKEQQRKNNFDIHQKPKKKKNDENEKRIYKEISSIPISIFARRLYVTSLLISILIFSIFSFLWYNLFDNIYILFNYINVNSKIESNAYRFFFLYQQLIYTKLTLNDFNEILGTNFNELILYQEELNLKIIVDSEKIISTINKYNEIGLTCESFYHSVNDIRIVKIEKEHPEFNITNKLIDVCNAKQFLGYINDNFVTQKTFSLIYKGIMSNTQITDENREYFLTKSSYYYDSLYYLLMIFRIYRTGVNKIIYTPSLNDYFKKISFLLTIETITDIILEIALLFCVIFMFVVKINFLYKRLLAITNIIKITKDDNFVI